MRSRDRKAKPIHAVVLLSFIREDESWTEEEEEEKEEEEEEEEEEHGKRFKIENVF